MSIKVPAQVIDKLVLEGARVLTEGSLDKAVKEQYLAAVEHRVIHTGMYYANRVKVRFLLTLEDGLIAVDDDNPPYDDMVYVEVWYTVRYDRTARRSKIYIPTFTIEVKCYSKCEHDIMTEGRHVESELDYAEKGIRSEVTFTAMVTKSSSVVLCTDMNDELVVEWNVHPYESYYSSNEPSFVSKKDILKYYCRPDSDDTLKTWCTSQFRKVLADAANMGFPLPKKRRSVDTSATM